MKERQHKALEAVRKMGVQISTVSAAVVLWRNTSVWQNQACLRHLTDLYISKHATRHFSTALFYSLLQLVPMMPIEINGSILIFRDVDKTRILPRNIYLKIADWHIDMKAPWISNGFFHVPAWSVCVLPAACTADAVRAAGGKTEGADM